MGVSLIVCVLELEQDKTPDFEAASVFLEKLTVSELRKIEAEMDDDDDDDDDDELPDDDASDVRARIDRALGTMKDGWSGQIRRIRRYRGKFSLMLIAGDTTWGDPVAEVEAMVLFKVSGLAAAAGFFS